MSSIKVLALPTIGWNYKGERKDFMARIRKCNPNGYYVIDGFSDANDLKTRIQKIIDRNGYPVLELLEIWCHAHPGKLNGLTYHNAVKFGKTLKKITSWSDEAKVFLSGCNTGLTNRNISKKLAEGLKFETGTFEHEITVFGSAGYLYGNHACGNAYTECAYIRTGEKIKKAFAFIKGFITSRGSLFQASLESMSVDIEFKPYKGCRKASGLNAYNKFKNR